MEGKRTIFGGVAKGLPGNRDFGNIFMLLAIAAAIGLYRIATTVLISHDGVYYIGQAQLFEVNFLNSIKSPIPGYPYLIFIAHKFLSLFVDGSSVQAWIYSAQGVTLLCRLFSLAPLYYTGKMMTGGRKSFWAILILVVLPYPASFAGDTMNDWPHLLFLATGFLILVRASNRGKWWAFGAVGLIAGTGYLIRVECAQLVVYGCLWLFLNFFRANRSMSRSHLTMSLVGLLGGFALLGVCHMGFRKSLPEKLQMFWSVSPSANIRIPAGNKDTAVYTAEFVPDDFVRGNMAKGFIKLAKRLNSTLMYVFFPPLIIGMWFDFRKGARRDNLTFFLNIFTLFNVLVLLLLYRNYGYISRRHVLPLAALTIFYVPIGLEILGGWFEEKFSRSGRKKNTDAEKGNFWFYVLIFTGVAICIPKLVRPLRQDKKEYLKASQWLRENTDKEAVIALPDQRISFYAGRKSYKERLYRRVQPTDTSYILTINDNSREVAPQVRKGMIATKEYTQTIAGRKKQSLLVIYKLTSRVAEME